MPPSLPERAFTFTLIALLAFLLLCLFDGEGHSAAPVCTHWASPHGTGSACSQSQPCTMQSFWPLATPGTVLCLRDGTYRGTESMILPPAGLRGTQAAPITVRAEHDGQVLLDAQHQGFAVRLAWHSGPETENAWFVVEGVNASNGLEATYSVSGSDNVVRRVIGWNGTSGQDDSNIFKVVGYRSRIEDCAGWGMNSRKIFDGAQGGNLQTAGYRRCWGEWNDAPLGPNSHPTNTLQLGYNTTNQLFENLLLTINLTGDPDESEGAISFMHNQYGYPNDIEGTRVLGSVLYYRPGARAAGYPLYGGGISNLALKDVVMFVPSDKPAMPPARFLGAGGNCGRPTPCVRNTCTNCLAVHAGTEVVNESNSGWTLPGLRQGQGLQAATGGQSPFTLLPGICTRYVDGQLTTQPLWPWPMNDRIKAARVASGFPTVDVTAEIESLLGPIPPACRSTGTEPPIPPDPPIPPASATPLSCVGLQGEGGGIAIACTPEGRRR